MGQTNSLVALFYIFFIIGFMTLSAIYQESKSGGSSKLLLRLKNIGKVCIRRRDYHPHILLGYSEFFIRAPPFVLRPAEAEVEGWLPFCCWEKADPRNKQHHQRRRCQSIYAGTRRRELKWKYLAERAREKSGSQKTIRELFCRPAPRFTLWCAPVARDENLHSARCALGK